MKSYIKYLTAAFAAAALAGSAYATPTLWLSDGINNVYVVDGAVNDQSPQAGVVTFIGSIGHWSINITSGLVIVGGGLPILDLNSTSVSTQAGTLHVYFSADGFGPTSGVLASTVGGETDGLASFATGYDPTNALFTPTWLTAQGPFGLGAYSSTAFASLSAAFPYSLTEMAWITHGDGVHSSSFDYKLRVPDGGTSALLLGLALLGMSFVARKFKSTKA